jgi:phospholipid transport system substrate-binding protein
MRRPSKTISQSLIAAALVLAAGGVLATAPSPFTAPALAQSGARSAGAEQFVQTQAQRALTILTQHQGDVATEKRLFRAFIDQAADVPRITFFVLGKYSRSISPGQQHEFGVVFREYASNVYESRLNEYHGESLRVTGSVARSPTDVIVQTQVYGGKLDQPVGVAWRVLAEGGGWKVVDVQVDGVWLAITQQQDFVSTIDNAGGNIQVLIDQLKRQVAKDEAGSR